MILRSSSGAWRTILANLLRRGLRPATVAIVAVALLSVAGILIGAPGATGGKRPIRLNGLSFDPLDGEPPIQAELRARGVPAGEVGYFLVQFKEPITTDMQKEVVAAGGRPLHFLHESTLVVRARGGDLAAIRRVGSVRWVGSFHPAYKLDARLTPDFDKVLTEEARRARQEAGDNGRYPEVDTRKAIPVRIVTMEPSVVDALAEQVRQLGGEGVRTSAQSPGMVRAVVPRSALTRIAHEPGVLWIERETPAWAFNDVARWTIQSFNGTTFAAPLHEHHLEGQGQTITIADTGLDYEHPAFSDPLVSVPGPSHRKVTAYYTPTGAEGDSSDAGGNHGTHVSGTVAGDNGIRHRFDGDPQAASGSTGPHDGQAHDAKIQVQDISNDPLGSGITPTDDFRDLFQAAATAGSWIHTNSWGGGGGGYYLSHQQETDDFIYTNPNFLVLFAAANNGPSLGTIDSEASAKNVISVGASSNGLNAVDVTDFSSRGPTADLRLKPDLLAPGYSIWSAEGCDPATACTTYTTKSGTSMATPTVAGAAALLRQYFSDGWYPTGLKTPGHERTPSAALLKAMLINSAVEVNGFEAYHNGETFYPNHNQGWGRIKLDEVAYFKGNARRLWVYEHAGLATGQTFSTTIKVTDPTQPLKVTLVWSDYPSVPQTTPALVNNLDLVVHAPDGAAYVGNRFIGYNPAESERYPILLEDDPLDAVNNVEGVLVRTAVNTCGAGYTIEVRGAEIGAPQCDECAVPPNNQAFALVVTGGIEPDTDVDGTFDCADSDDDGDGDPDATDCLPLDARAGHGIVEGTVAAGGSTTACQDGIDNDCDGAVDLDCAIDVRTTSGQWLGPGAVDSGTQANMTAASAPNTYQVLKETAVIKQLVAVWTFNVTADTAAYDLNMEAFHSSTAGSDDWSLSYIKKSDTSQCNNNLTGWNSLFTVTKTADDNTAQKASIGSLSPGVVCIRAADTKPSNDTQADKLTVDRVFLSPTPQCADADGDAYPATCTGCVSTACPAIDCNDNDPTIHPGPRERPIGGALCTDGDDNDCDGLIDSTDPGCGLPPPDVKASSESTLVGSKVGAYGLTWTSDNVREILQENGSQGLTHTWTFQNVPDGFSHSLNYEGLRLNNSDGDNFRLTYSYDQQTWYDVGLIDKQFEPFGNGVITGGVWPGIVYIRIQDTAGGSNSDTVEIDYLSISTTP